MQNRVDVETEAWTWRAWLLAAICMVAGIGFHALIDHAYDQPLALPRQALAAFVGVASLSFVLTVERLRWAWAAVFALGWGAVIAFIGWHTAGYNRGGEIFDFPFFSGMLAVLLAAPIFQTMRDMGRRELPYARLHNHAWTDAVIGAAGLAFVAASFLLAHLIAQMFKLIGITLISQLLNQGWFGWMLAGAAFGGAVGLLRERDRLVGAMQKLVMVVFAILAPVLAIALVVFLVSLISTGLQPLWESRIDTAPLMLASGAGALLLINAVIGNGGPDEDRPHAILHLSALALSLCVLPLAIIAAVSLGVRVEQHGWTPERLWGAVAIVVALGYGAAGCWSVIRARVGFEDVLRRWQVRLAVAMVGLALFLALPIVDFGAIAARDQLARLETGKISEVEFDWTSMAFDFGPAGRKALAQIAAGKGKRAELAKAALAADHKWSVSDELEVAQLQSDRARRMRVIPENARLSESLLGTVNATRLCRKDICVIRRINDQSWVVIGRTSPRAANITAQRLVFDPEEGTWRTDFFLGVAAVDTPATDGQPVDLNTATVEVRQVSRSQVFVNGKPVGDAFKSTAP